MSEFENVEDIQSRFKAAQHKRSVGFHDVFVKSESGRLVLEEFINKYCMNNVSVNASEREVGFHDGGRQVVLEIIAQINIAEGKNNE